MGAGDDRSLAGHLEAAREAHFAGRAAERARLRAALDDPRPATFFVHGPGGIGKTTLLEQFARDARRAGHDPVRVDGRDLAADAAALAAAIEPAAARAAAGGRAILILDTFEMIGGLELYLRARLLPSLPGAPLVIVAGRDPPSAAWRADPAWHGTLVVLPLGALAPEESADLLARRGVTGAAGALHEVSHGHPLALALIAEIAAQRGDAGWVPALTPDLVQALVERFVRDVPGPDHQRALELCAILRVTDESLLREVVGDAAPELYRWLRGLSFVQATAEGVFPHDLAREVIAGDLAARDRRRRDELVAQVRDLHLAALVRTAELERRRRIVRDFLFASRHLRGLRSFFTWRDDAAGWGEPARPEDADAVLGLLAEHEGPEAVALARYWWDRQRSAFTIFRSAEGRPAGLMVLLALAGFDRRDRDADPAIDAAARHAERAGPLEAGDQVLYVRFFGTAGAWQLVAPIQDMIQLRATVAWLSTRDLAWSYVALRSAAIWSAQFAALGMPAADDAGFTTDGVRQIVHVHDWRRHPARRWLAGQLRDVPGGPAAAWPALTADELAAAVRAALRDFTRAGALERSPLLGAAFIRAAAGAAAPTVETVRAVLRDLVEELAGHPRDRKAAAVLRATYLVPAPSQEAAAERLDLPMGTYRRQLKRGLERVAELVRERERAALRTPVSPSGPTTLPR